MGGGGRGGPPLRRSQSWVWGGRRRRGHCSDRGADPQVEDMM